MFFAIASSFSDITGGELTALPVALILFTGLAVNNINKITWSSASEINCASFELQKSNNENIFTTIYYTSGAGNSNEIKQYYFNAINNRIAISFYNLNSIIIYGSEC